MRYGTNQHNNQPIYYMRNIKEVGPAHTSALGDQISGDAYHVVEEGFEVMIHNNIL
jgi:hypothetical protein